MCPAVTTAEAKGAATETATRELTENLDILYAIEDRDEQNKVWLELQKKHHPETTKFVQLTTDRELEHYEFMKVILPMISEVEYDLTKREHHDYSKEGMFFFALPAFYDGGVKGPKIKAMVDAELKRHYRLEAHHPEYEQYNNGKECQKSDIVEMAIDRLARNAQFGDGFIRQDSVMRFLPKFTLGNNEEKQAIFKLYIGKYLDLVQTEFYKMFPESKEWKKD